MSHHCHARDCNVSVPPEMLFCRLHWRRVPQKIQKAVWAAYRVGQCADRNPSESWHEAADAAIGFVAAVEGKPIRRSEVMAIRKYGYEEKELNKEPRP